MSAATGLAVASMMGEPHNFIFMAMVGNVVPGGPAASPLAGLLVSGERPMLATAGDSGSALFTSSRLLVGQQAGILSKRLTVKSLRRDHIFAYAIDPDSYVTLDLFGAFGKANLLFDAEFEPMQLSEWLGITLAGSASQEN